MAIHTKHPVSAPPAAPVREKTGHLLLRGWCVFVLILVLAGPAWVNAVGAVAASAVGAVAAVVSIAVWLTTRPVLQWRRLPWIALAFVLFSGLAVVWHPEPAVALRGWLLLTGVTFFGVFVAASLTWRDVVRTLASALKWIIALSLVFELAVAVFVRAPLGARFSLDADAPVWSTGDFFGTGPLGGIVGDHDLLAALTVLAVVTFTIRFLAGAPRRSLLLVWIVVAVFLLVRAESATAYIALAGATLVLTTVLLMRTARAPGERTRYYLLYAAAGVAGGGVVASAYGSTLVRERGAWAGVLVDAGGVAVALLALALLAFIWRSWFFAVDRPRYDLRADRSYSPLALLPTLVAALVLVESVTQAETALLWGWMLLVLLGAKIKQAPLVGVGPAEQSLAIERGELHTHGT